jgi:polyisoprenoid-binding protein YceI
MEYVGTATALEWFGLLAQCVSSRATPNFNRERPGGDSTASIERDNFGLGTGKAPRVGYAVVQKILA